MTSTTCALNRKYALNKHVRLITGLYGVQFLQLLQVLQLHLS